MRVGRSLFGFTEKPSRRLLAGAVALALAGAAITAAAAPAGAAENTKVGGTGASLPAGLTVSTGDMTVTTPGTVIANKEIRGRVIVKANNVTIRNCKIVGGAALTSVGALVQSWYGATGLVIENTVISAAKPSVYVDGISGANFTATRVTVSNVVDSVKILGSNVTVTDSVLKANYHQKSDPLQGNGPTHDDNIQIESGSNIVISNNTLSGAANAAIMLTQNQAAVTSIAIKYNKLSDGGCTVNIDEKGKGAVKLLYLYRNQFGLGGYGKVCAVRIPKTTAAINAGIVFGNLFTDGSAATLQVF